MRLLKIFLLSLAVAFSSLAVTSTPASGQLIVNSYRHAAAFTTEYQAVLDRATTLGYTKPSAGQQVKQNQLIVDLKAAGIWTLLDVFYVFATDGSSDFATLNWKAPASFQCTKVNSPTFTVNEGFTGNGTSSYLNTNWAPSGGVNFTLNEAGAGIYSFTAGQTGPDQLFGAFDTGTINGVQFTPRIPTDVLRFRVNTTTLTDLVSTDGSGFWHEKRTSSTAVSVYRNGSLFGSSSVSSTARPVVSVYVLALNIGNTLNGPSVRKAGTFWAGASLNGLESSFYTAWNNYRTSL